MCDPDCCRAYALEMFCNGKLISVLSLITISKQEITNSFPLDRFLDKYYTDLEKADVDMAYFIDRGGFAMDWALQIYGLT